MTLPSGVLSLVWLPVQLPVLVLVVRGYVVGFSELFEISAARLLFASAGALLLSAFVSPLLLIPGAWALVRFQGLWEALL